MDSAVLEKKLNLGRILNILPYSSGQHNQTYKVTTAKGTYSLRIYNYKKPAQIQFELAFLNKLDGLKVPELVKVRGSYLFEIETKSAILYKYLPGRHLTVFTSRQLKEVGACLAAFHNRTKHFRWIRPRSKFYDLPDAKIKTFATVARNAQVPYLNLLPSIITELKQNRPARDLPQGPIHVDVKPENVLFYRGKLSGVIDFDNSYIGPYLLDLAKAMIWFGTRNKKFSVRDARMVYIGYVKKRRLSALEHQELYKAVKFAFLSHVFVDYYMYAIRATAKEYFDWIVKELYQAYKTFRMPKEAFYTMFR